MNIRKILLSFLCIMLIISISGCQKSNIDKTDEEKLSYLSQRDITDTSLRSDNFFKEGEWIYFGNSNDDLKIYKMKTDHSGITKISDKRTSNIIALDGWIYYNDIDDEHKLYRMKIDGSADISISNQRVDFFVIDKGYIYYLDNQAYDLHKLNLDGTNPTRLAGIAAKDFHVTGEVIFYIEVKHNPDAVYYMNLDGTGHSRLGIKAASIYVSQEMLYYINTKGETLSVHLMKEGKEPQKITDVPYEKIVKVTDKHIYAIAQNSYLDDIHVINKNNGATVQMQKLSGAVAHNIESVSVIDDEFYGFGTVYDIDVVRIKDNDEETNILYNQIADSFMVEGDRIYYYNPSGIYRVNVDGTKRVKLTEDKVYSRYDNQVTPNPLFVMKEDWIYYIVQQDGKNLLHRVKKDGSEKVKLQEDSVSKFIIYGDYIYYINETDKGILYHMKLDGSQNLKFGNERPLDIEIVEGWIYYLNISDGKEYKIGVFGSQKQRLSKTEQYLYKTKTFISDKWHSDRWHYYTEDRNIVRKSLDSGEVQTIATDSQYTIIEVDDQWIYFTTSDYLGGPYGTKVEYFKARKDGTQITKIDIGQLGSINVKDGWSYYYRAIPSKKMIRLSSDETKVEIID